MNSSIRQTIGKNIKSLRESLGLSQLKFANLIEISRASLINIESGKKGYNLNLLDKILLFSNYKLEELSKEFFLIPNDFRENLASRYKDDPATYTILNGKPTIVYAIKYKLLNSNFLDEPKEINEIKHFFKSFGWEFNGSSIQNALKRMPTLILIQAHEKKKNTNVYSNML